MSSYITISPATSFALPVASSPTPLPPAFGPVSLLLMRFGLPWLGGIDAPVIDRSGDAFPCFVVKKRGRGENDAYPAMGRSNGPLVGTRTACRSDASQG